MFSIPLGIMYGADVRNLPLSNATNPHLLVTLLLREYILIYYDNLSVNCRRLHPQITHRVLLGQHRWWLPRWLTRRVLLPR
jgi:hypothetical protein